MTELEADPIDRHRTFSLSPPVNGVHKILAGAAFDADHAGPVRDVYGRVVIAQRDYRLIQQVFSWECGGTAVSEQVEEL